MAASSSSSAPASSRRKCPCSLNFSAFETRPAATHLPPPPRFPRLSQPPVFIHRRRSMKKRSKVLASMLGIACLVASATSTAWAQQTPDKLKIGFITDMSSLYADLEGKNGALAIQMAIDDFGGKVLGMPIEFLSADAQNT